MKDRTFLAVYLGLVACVTSIHDLRFLAAALAGVLVASGKGAPRLLARTIRSVLFFNLVVSVSYAALSLLRGGIDGETLARLNLRVLALTSLTFLVTERIDPFRALSFSRSLLFLLTLAYGQIAVFRRMLDDFRLALRSRSPVRPRTADLYRHAGATGAFFLEKALHDSTEITQAMRSRGFTHDSD